MVEEIKENGIHGYWSEIIMKMKTNEKIVWDYCDEKSYKPEKYSFVIDKQCGARLGEICKKNELLIYTFLVAVLNVSLSKYTSRNEITIGVPPYNDKLQKKIMPSKVLPLMSCLDYEKTYIEYMMSIKKQISEVYKNQAYFKPNLIQVNSTSHNIMEFTPISICMKNLHLENYINYISSSKHNELMFLFELSSDESIKVDIIYNLNKVSQTTVIDISKIYVNVLNEVLYNHNVKIDNIKLISEKEACQILNEFNSTDIDYSEDKTVQELFEEQVEKTPDNIAVAFEDKSLTYRELNEKANSLAKVLRDKGVKADLVVGIMAQRSLEMIIGIIAILKSGGAYLPIDPAYPKDRIKYMMEDSQSNILLSTESLPKNVEFGQEVIYLSNEELFNGEGSNLKKINMTNDLIYIIYTSGTTGNPKGTIVKHHSFTNLMQWYCNELTVSEKDNILLVASISFDLAQKNIYAPLITGGKLILANKGIIDYQKISTIISKEEVSIINCAPSMFYPIVEMGKEKNYSGLRSLRYVALGGEPINRKKLNDWMNSAEYCCEILNTYGPTECTDIATFYRLEKDASVIPIGKPINNVKVYVLDKNRNLLPIGVPGELYISGVGVSRGYFNRPELTKERFMENLFEQRTQIYKTGDLVKWLLDGNIEFLGRIDNQVKVRGYRIELGEIENRLLQHESIKEAAVLVKENKDSDKYICAYVVSNKDISSLDLIRYLGRSLPKYMIPERFISLKEMPLGPNGKLDRKTLMLYEIDNELSEKVINEKSEVEEKLAIIWSKILNINKDEILTKHDYFELGGNSLNTISLINLINKHFNVKITTKEIFSNSSLKDQSDIIKIKLRLTDSIIEANDYIKETENDTIIIIDKEKIFMMISEVIENNKQIKKQFEDSNNIKYSDMIPTLLYQMKLKTKSISRRKVELSSITLEEIQNRLKNFINKYELLRSYIIKTNNGYSFASFDEITDIPLHIVDLSSYSYLDAKYVKKKILDEVIKKFISNQILDELLWMTIIFKENDCYTIWLITDHKISDGYTAEIIGRNLSKKSDKILNIEAHSYFKYMNDTQNLLTQEKINNYYYSNDYGELNDSINEYYTNISKYGDINNTPVVFKYTFKEDISQNSEKKEEIAFNLVVKICGILFNLKKVPISILRNGRCFNNTNYSNTVGDISTRFSIAFSNDEVQSENNYIKLLSFENKYYVNNGINFRYMICDNLGFETYEIPQLLKSVPIIYNFLGENLEEVKIDDTKKYLEFLITKIQKNKYSIKVKTSNQTIYILMQNGIRDEKLAQILSLGLEKFI